MNKVHTFETGQTMTLAHFLTAHSFADLPPETTRRAKDFVLDTLGATIGGVATTEARIVADHTRDQGGREECTVVGHDFRTNAANAAFANSLASHVLELDDTHRDSIMHVAAPVIPAALAMAERQGSSGADFLASVVLGYEAGIRPANAIQPSHWSRGFLVMGTCGAFGSAAAAGHLLGFDADRLGNALGLAGMYAASINSSIYGEGDMGKRLSPAHAASSGISAAMLAARGFTGSKGVFEGQKGFCMAFSDDYDLSRITDNLGTPWEIMRSSMKPYACCRYNHGAIDGLLHIMATEGLTAADIAEVTVATFEAAVLNRRHSTQPVTHFDGQMSIPFSLAVAAHAGALSFADFPEALIASPQHQAFATRVKLVADPELTRAFPKDWSTRVTIETTDGRTFTHHVPYPKGEPEAWMTDDEIRGKFLDLAALEMSRDQAEDIVALVYALDAEPNMDRLARLLAR